MKKNGFRRLLTEKFCPSFFDKDGKPIWIDFYGNQYLPNNYGRVNNYLDDGYAFVPYIPIVSTLVCSDTFTPTIKKTASRYFLSVDPAFGFDEATITTFKITGDTWEHITLP